MSLMRWDPFGERTGLREIMDRLLEENFVPFRRTETAMGMAFAVDVLEKDNAYEVKASLPGVKPEDVDVTISGNVLTIRGERKEAREEKEPNYLLRERRYGVFMRSIALPTDVDAEHTQAAFEHGILTLSIPKSEEAKPKRIEVKPQRAVGGGTQAPQMSQSQQRPQSQQSVETQQPRGQGGIH